MSGSHLSKDFFELVKAIGESKSKQEEDRIIMIEVGILKRKMPEATVSRKKMKEFLVRMIYVEMLGHDASFGYIKAVELTASQNLAQKRTGYLTAALTLSPNHEFRFMLVNQMQRDLSSSNMLEAAAALTALCKLATVDMIPAVMTDVVRLLKHDRELVRKKAVMALHRMNQMDPDSVSHMGEHLRRMLCDRDPSVMGAALCLLHDMARVDASSYKDLVPSFVSILKQITEHRLPRDFDYHRMPAPWIQMRLLRILALLGRADRATSEGMYEVLMDVMRRADTGINVGYAVVYECVRTVTTIYPNAPLLDTAAASISRFISAENHNLKYVGVTGLAAIVRDHPKYAQEHQMAVIDCLEDPDETLKRKTLDLLYTMTNPINVEFIAEKLLSFLEQGTDSFWRQDLVNRITQCAERFAPSNSWYVRIITRVFRLAGDMVKADVGHNLMQLIAEGSGEDEEGDVELRREAVDNYLELLDTPAVPDQLMQVMAWVLGEYGALASIEGGLRAVSQRLCDVAEGVSFRDPSTCGFVVTALMKLSAQSGEVSPPVAHLLTLYSQSKHSDLQQRCLEFLQLAREGPAAMAAVLPVDASCEDVEADENLSHLDDIVKTALAAGAVGYSPPAEMDGDSDGEESAATGAAGSSFNLTPYARPSQPSTVTPMAQSAAATAAHGGSLEPSQSSTATSGAGMAPSTADIFASGPRLRPVSKVWGRPKPGDKPPPPPAAGGASSSTTGEAGPVYPLPGVSVAADPAPGGGGGYASSRRDSNSGVPQEDPAIAAQRAEKERMAAMLFGGMGAGGAGSGSGAGGQREARSGSRDSLAQQREKTRPNPTEAAAAAAAATSAEVSAPSTSSLVSAAAHTSPASPVVNPPADLLDLLSDNNGDSNSTATGAAAATNNGTLISGDKADDGNSSGVQMSSVDRFGIDNLLGVGSGGDKQNGTANGSVSGPMGDLLGGGSGGGGGGATATTATDVNGSSGGLDVLNKYDGSAAAGAATSTIPSGPAASSSTSNLRDSPSLLGGSPTATGSSGVGGLDLSGLLGGSSSFTGGGSEAPFSYGGHAVRPLAIATGEFGRKWMACSGERKAVGNRVGPSLALSPQAVADRLASRLGVHVVEIIPHTAEGICAGQVEGGSGRTCLVHCRVWAARGTVDLAVRAEDPKLAEAAVVFAKTALAQ